jgi:phosphoketolase
MPEVLSQPELEAMHAYWRAANYLSVGQIYLLDNPLLQEPLTLEHIKPRLLGHWGTTPGLNFIYVHLNRLIKKYDLNMIYICGPGHGAGLGRKGRDDPRSPTASHGLGHLGLSRPGSRGLSFSLFGE